MIGSDDFWSSESDAPLLNRNANFLTKESAESIIERAKVLVDLVEVKAGGPFEIDLLPDCDDEAAKRIFTLDAERTFKDEKYRKEMIKVLSSLWPELQDYHQGLGFLVAYLLLLLPACDVAKVAIGLHRHYIPGYFKSAPAAYVRDAKVFQKLVEKFFPDVASHTESMIVPEAYVSKWFIGMNVHVLTFEAVLMFLEAFFDKGDTFLFQFALALIKNCNQAILETKDVSVVLAILRLDDSVFPDTTKAEGDDTEGSFFTKIVLDAIDFDLGDTDIEKLREEATEEIRQQDEKRKKRDAELGLDSDDEIVFSDEEEEEEEEDEDGDEDEKGDEDKKEAEKIDENGKDKKPSDL